ncbi:MAG: DUF58 domain-containing protein [Oscillospiraceae bacterium]|jgi:uncharacterized protein (DUF58 family)|nr:DUF58 domain-containing protein [Oscillospiraceae bacterium]
MARKRKHRPLTRRVSYLILLAAAFLCAVFAGGRVMHTLFSLCLALPLLSLLHLLLVRRRFVVSHGLAQTVIPKGTETRYKMRLVNKSRLPAALFVVLAGRPPTLSGAGTETGRVTGRLAPGRPLNLSANTGFLYRGLYEIAAPAVRVLDMLGLFALRLSPPPPVALTVCPRVHPLPQCRRLAALTVQARPRHTNRTGDDVSTVSDTRAYQYGDPMHRIHWKLSAQKGEMISRLYEDENSPALLLVLDTAPPPCGETGSPLEVADRMVECAVSVLSFCLQHNVRAHLVHRAEGRVCRFEQSDKLSFDHLFRHLAALSFDAEDSLTDVLRELAADRPFADVVVFTAALPEGLPDALARLTGQAGVRPGVVYTPPEGAQPPSWEGPLPFSLCEIKQGDGIADALARL